MGQKWGVGGGVFKQKELQEQRPETEQPGSCEAALGQGARATGRAARE